MSDMAKVIPIEAAKSFVKGMEDAFDELFIKETGIEGMHSDEEEYQFAADCLTDAYRFLGKKINILTAFNVDSELIFMEDYLSSVEYDDTIAQEIQLLREEAYELTLEKILSYCHRLPEITIPSITKPTY